MTTRKPEPASNPRRAPSSPAPGARFSLWRRPPDRPRVDRAVLWSVFLFLLNFPLILVFLAVVGAFAMEAGIDLGGDDPRIGLFNALYIAAVLAVWVVAAFLGIRGWRRSGQRVGLVSAVLCLLSGVGFVALPSLV